MKEHSFIRVDVIYTDEEAPAAISSEKCGFIDGKLILKGRNFSQMPHGAAVEAVGYFSDGFVMIEGEVALSTESQLNIIVKKMGDKQERRSFLKVKTSIYTILSKAYSLGRSGRAYRINETILTKDLSLGGISFYSNRVLFKKQKIEIDFSSVLPGFKAEAEVLRKVRGSFLHKIKGAFKRYRYIYACRFRKISGEEERALCEFVFRTQLENRRILLKNGG
ncbi:MAG TPA: PilZ domain-containing protein [Anaerovoracaceae bacterium]|nr:PilZ domain-containing protein [Anaerovoracaceae bacterium]